MMGGWVDRSLGGWIGARWMVGWMMMVIVMMTIDSDDDNR